MHEIICERLDDFGRGVGHINGKVIFIPDFLPSEKALVNVILDKKRFMMGEITELKTKSKDRVCFDCPYDNCGCSLKNYDYEKSLQYKKNKVEGILKKFANVDFNIKEIIPCLNLPSYRNKITLKVRNGKLGYFKNNSNELIEIDKCLIAKNEINEVIKVLKEEELSKVKEIVIKAMDEVMIIIYGIMDINVLKNYADSIYMNDNLVYGKEKILNHILDYKFLVSKDSFFQVNNEVTKKLYSKIVEFVGKGEALLDLYCGTGTISLCLSKNFKKVIGVEINKEAIECADENKELNKITNVNFICGDANKIDSKADVVIVDPARAGIKEEGINNILSIKPNRIVYVSCNPVTLARDLKQISKLYEVKDIVLYDMFPLTHHVECVCLLELK